jgi:excisionase family DNA binding protein
VLIDGPAVLLSARVCARLDAIVDAVDRQSRLDGLPLPPEVRAALDGIRAAGRTYRSAARAALPTATADSGSTGSAATPRSVKVGDMTTTAVAAQLKTGERNVRDLAARGALPGRRVGRAWLFDAVDVAEYLDTRQEAS